MSRVFTPHDYQKDIVEFITHHERCAIFCGMGGGKSVSTLLALDNLSLTEDVYPVLVIAPLRVANSTWVDEISKWSFSEHLKVVPITGTLKQRTVAVKTPADIYTTNYENLKWLTSYYGDDWPFKTVVADECFVAGTMISTPNGDVPIESIKVGDLVQTHVGPRKVTYAFKNFTNPSNLVSLTLNNGVELHVTKTHPFFTDAGWVSAEACGRRKLFDGDSLRHLSEAVSKKAMRGAPESLPGGVSILLKGLPNEGFLRKESEFSGNKSKKHDGALGYHGDFLELWEAMVGGDACENVSRQEGETFSGKARRERHRYVGVRGDGGRGDSRRFPVESYCQLEGEWGRLSVALQTRLWESSDEGLSGGGRLQSQQLPDYESRQEENGEITVVGVDRFQNEERASSVAVFNIEVEGAPTYFANGVLVHNCTRLKSFRTRQGSKRAKELGKIAHTKIKRFIGLTGTPSPNGLSDLWGQMWFIDRGKRLGSSFSAFEARWFTKGYDGFSIKPTPNAQREIEELIRDVCLTVTGLPVDEPIHNPIYVDLPKDARAIYDEMEKQMFAEIEEVGVEALNAAAKTIKCQQIAAGSIITDESGSWSKVHDEKIEALRSVVEEAAGNPVLVAYKFKADLERLRAAFPKGRQLDADPKTIRDWNDGKIELLFAQPISCGHGINLAQGGNILAFFNVDWSLETHMQIIERIGPMRQKQAGIDRPVFIHYILARDTVDEMILDRLKTKKTVQETLLDAMRRKRGN